MSRHFAAGVVAAACMALMPAGAQTPDSVVRRHQRLLDSLSNALRIVQSRLDSLERAGGAAAPAPVVQRSAGAYMNIGFDGLVDGGWSSIPDVRAIQVGDHDPLVRGFTVPNAELTLDANVDPYFKGFTNIVYKLDENGETGIELEEMFILTTSLPWNLQ